MKDITQDWLESASLDLENIKHIIHDERLTGHVAFHAQQAIEKSLKALIEEHGIRVPKIHSIEKLFSICEELINVRPDEDIIIELDSLYTESRYPGELGLLPNGKPSIEQAILYFEFAKNTNNSIIESIKKQ